MPTVIGRRELITAVSGAVAWPLTARAQRPTSLHIGIVTIQSRTTPIYAAFDQRLRELGHIEGQNLVTDYLNGVVGVEPSEAIKAAQACRTSGERYKANGKGLFEGDRFDTPTLHVDCRVGDNFSLLGGFKP